MYITRLEVAALAARWVVEDGLDFGSAKKRAMESLGISGRAASPDNQELEEAVRDYIATFCADTQAVELAALRRCALIWMRRLAAFRPYVTGAVWSGIATRWSDIHLMLFCDDPKSAELYLINQGVPYEAAASTNQRGDLMPVLSVDYFCEDLKENIGVHMSIYDADELRRQPRIQSGGRPLRGDAQALQRLIGDLG